MPEHVSLQAIVPDHLAFTRLDRIASELFPEYSRARLQDWIRSGELTVDGELRRPKDKLYGGEELVVEAELASQGYTAEPVPFPVVYEDEDVIVVNKPAGLVVHPGAGNLHGTLLNGLLHHDAALSVMPRAGIVHRLDKDTTGLLVVARNLSSQNSLVQQLQARSVTRVYEAICYGDVPHGGVVAAPIARHPVHRTRMAVVASGKEAVTHYSVLGHLDGYTHVELSLETGRTHQIRVHMQHLGFPLVGDPVYGGGFRQPRREALESVLRAFPRQALHARRLSFDHPGSREHMTFEVPLPDDFERLLSGLRDS